MNTRACRVGLLVACAWAGTPAIAAGPWYVATNGADAGRDGLSWGQAFATISNAVAQASSGAIYVSNGVYTLSAQVTVDKALTIVGFNGPANTVVDGNAAVRCFQLNHASAVLRGLTISNGVAGSGNNYNGAGVRLLQGTLDNCLVVKNVATGFGGGIHVGWSLDIAGGTGTAITNCIIRQNTALTGGGVSLYAGGGNSYSIAINNCEISSNRAITPATGGGTEPGGGGVYFQGAILTVRNSRIAGNVADGAGNVNKSARGGGVSISTPQTAILFENCEIVGNTVSNSSNVCRGGGIHAGGGSNVIRNCLVAGNLSQNGAPGGGGIYFDGASCTNMIESCTLAGNYAANIGNGIYLLGNGSDEVRNCVVYSNGTTANWYLGNTARTNNVSFTCTPDLMGGRGNKTDAPQFVNAAAGNYRFGSRSPCVNAGTNVAWMNTAADLDGRMRLRYGTVDMGAYEAIYAGTIYGIR